MNDVAIRKKKELLRVKLSEILRKHIDNPRLSSISITRLEVDKGLESMKVFFTSFLSQIPPSHLENELNNISKLIRFKLSKSLNTRSTPALRFIYDKNLDNIAKIDEIIKKIHSEPEN